MRQLMEYLISKENKGKAKTNYKDSLRTGDIVKSKEGDIWIFFTADDFNTQLKAQCPIYFKTHWYPCQSLLGINTGIFVMITNNNFSSWMPYDKYLPNLDYKSLGFSSRSYSIEYIYYSPKPFDKSLLTSTFLNKDWALNEIKNRKETRLKK